MISYELAMGLSIISVILITGTLSLRGIAEGQAGTWLGFIPQWNVFLQPLGFIIFFVCALAETNRAPFDLPECETELVRRLPHRIQCHETGLVPVCRVYQYVHLFGSYINRLLWRLQLPRY
jgi:NADH:ubiquinone oxidoreductase subunit H